MKIGIVTATNPATCACRVRFDDQDGMVSDWLPVVQKKSLKDKAYWMPDVNEHVVCLLDDNAEAGVILGAIYSEVDTPPVNSQDTYHVRFEDGTTIEYDRAVHKLTADVRGDVEIAASGTLTAVVTGNSTITTPLCTINGNLKVNGNITASGEVADANGAKTMSGMRGIFNGHTHPENGSGGGTTSTPNQQQ